MRDLDFIRLQNIGNRLLELCLQKNLTQKELAFLVDVEISQITRIERGIINTSILSLMRTTDALEISISDFLKILILQTKKSIRKRQHRNNNSCHENLVGNRQKPVLSV
ncbi:helix-turn-helix domain-containing protein [Chryseobacterium gilvum]|uniref:helix-turn-helix domain-containing protein n=1 Tax=Chryseobacterium gilvum TaxID=2976534 RepID=UPI0034A345EB